MVSAGVILAIVFVCFVGEAVAVRLLGHGPNDPFPLAADINNNFLPVGLWTRVPDTHSVAATAQTPHTLLIFGADGQLGRDVFLRVLDGGRVSLEIGFGAALVATLLGGTLGVISGYFGGLPDAAMTRLADVIMGFPVLLFLLMLGLTGADRLQTVTLHGLFPTGVVELVVVLGVLYCFYPLRLVRSQVLSLREREFVEAARSIGAGDLRIMRHHLVPWVWGSLVIYGTQLFAFTIFLEAFLGFSNVGITLPQASWGNLIATNYGALFEEPSAFFTAEAIHRSQLILLWPSVLVFLTILCTVLFAEGVRSAFDPGSVPS
jgi:peptide/nickel transport system permease protein